MNNASVRVCIAGPTPADEWLLSQQGRLMTNMDEPYSLMTYVAHD